MAEVDKKKFDYSLQLEDALNNLKGIEGISVERIDTIETLVANLAQTIAKQTAVISTVVKTNALLLESISRLTDRIVQLESLNVIDTRTFDFSKAN